MKKTVLITGCSTGIGFHAAITLHQSKQYQVFATVRTQLDQQKLESLGITTLLMDLVDSQSIQAVIKRVLQDSNNNLYALVNNGAYGQVGALQDISRQALTKQFETNVFGWHELTMGLLPSMKSNKVGRIIYISSVLGFVAMPLRGAYNASKFAIEGLVDTLRLELIGTGIQLSLIQPGPIESNFRHNAYRAFQDNVKVSGSDYQSNYKGMVERLNSAKSAPFTLSVNSVVDCVQHALVAKRAKIRYKVTFPTKLFSILKRILPSRWLDKFLNKAGGGGKR